MWWIRAAITEYVLRSWSLVKMGTLAAQKKLFFSLGRIKRELSILADGPISDEHAEEVAEALHVSRQDVIDMDRRLGSPDVSLNAPRSREDGESAEFMETLVDESPGPEALAAASEETARRRDLLTRALQTLPERERHILSERQLSEQPKTLEELGTVYGISRERVRQLEVRAFERLKKAVEKLALVPAAASAVA
jgi:RNA polymerase sigma-32 factor